MTDSTKDRITGHVDETKGKAKSAIGDMTGDEQTQSEGQADQAEGKLQNAWGSAKDEAREMMSDDDD